MALIEKQDKTPRVELKVKLDERIVNELEQYCGWLESDTDYVVGAVLTMTFAKDKAWQQMKAQLESGADGPPVVKRGRKAKAVTA